MPITYNKNQSPFGAHLQKYWDRRHELFSRFDEEIQIDEIGLYSATSEKIALEQAKKMNCKSVLDGFCGVGGNTIVFARLGMKVMAIEKNKTRLEMARHNAALYGVADKITFIHGDFLIEAPKIKTEGVFIDLEWGEPEYKQLKRFKLSDFRPDGNDVLKLVFANFSEIAMKIPENFDLSELKKYNKPYKIEDNLMHGKVVFRTVYFL